MMPIALARVSSIDCGNVVRTGFFKTGRARDVDEIADDLPQFLAVDQFLRLLLHGG
jgi:hypothetical protein